MGTVGDGSMGASLPRVALIGLFVTALVAAQVTASKVVELSLPFGIPATGESILVPASVFAYSMTFFASDCYTEIYGRRAGQTLVNVAFVMNLVLLGLLWLAILAPISGDSPVGQGQFSEVLGSSTWVIAGSFVAYVASQNWDVVVFHRLKERTDGERLWLRNVASTASSQFIDTFLFICVAFVLLQGVPLSVGFGLFVGQYVFKLGLALLDTPFVYAVVGFVSAERREGTNGAAG